MEEKCTDVEPNEKYKHLALVASSGTILALNLFGIFKDIMGIDTALIVAIFWGIPIYWEAVKGFVHKHICAEVLVTIAAIAAIYVQQYLAAGEVILIMLVGEALESYAVDRTRLNIRELICMTPKKARVRRGQEEMEVPIGEVARGDIVIVKPGERIPVDGVVLSGNAAVNQVHITGESIPIDRQRGDQVYTGSLLELGMLAIETRRVGEDTSLAKVIKLVEEAQDKKAPIQRIADRFSSYFVPIICATSLTVFLLTFDIIRAVTILIIACPCALVLATPTAVVSAIGNVAKRGILIKGGVHLETLGKIDTLVVDKTGTMTLGEPHVTDILSFKGKSEKHVLELAATAERFSEHALAKAIMKKAQELQIKAEDPDSFHVFPGLGVSAFHKGRKIFVGSSKLLEANRIVIEDEVRKNLIELESQGKTTVLVANDLDIIGMLAVADILRKDACEAVTKLQHFGLRNIVMLTGDNPQTAKAIADKLGIEKVHAQLLPEDKIDIVNQLKAEGHKVAMVGDGINDAPALAASDVGIAMGAAGTDTAIEAANIVLMSDNLLNVEYAIKLSRRAVKIILQNIFYFAVIVNAVGVAVAALGYLSPAMAAIVHQISSLAVVFNSLRLLGYKS